MRATIIREIKSGNATIRIDATYCKNTTNEEVKEILKNVSAIASEYYRSKALQEKKRKKAVSAGRRKHEGDHDVHTGIDSVSGT